METAKDFIFLGSKITADGDCSHEIKRRLTHWKKSYDQSRQHIKKQRHYFADKGLSRQSYDFSSSHVCMLELDHKESWALKNWCFWTVVLEKTLQSPLGCKKIKSVHPKGNQPWIFTERTDAKAEALLFWPLDVKSRLTGKDPDAGKDWRQEEKVMTEDEMVRWYLGLSRHEFVQAPGVGDGQGSLVCCSLWGTLPSNWTDNATHYRILSLRFLERVSPYHITFHSFFQ